MQVYETAPAEAGAKSIVVIRVPDSVLADPLRAGDVMHCAELDFQRAVILLGADTGEKLGSLRRHLQDFDPQKVKWSQWIMA